MNNLLFKLIAFVVILPATNSFTYGQVLKSSVENLNDLSHYLVKIDSIYGNDFLLENGKFYISEYPNANGHPYLLKEYKSGELNLNSNYYNNLKLLLDINSDQLIFLKGNKTPLIVNKVNIKQFKLEDRIFLNYSGENEGIKKGFYEQIYISQNFLVIVKWHKYFSEVFNDKFSGKYTWSKRKLYLKKNDLFVQINSKKDIVQLFDTKENEIKKLLKSGKIKILKSDISKLSNFFYQLDKLLM